MKFKQKPPISEAILAGCKIWSGSLRKRLIPDPETNTAATYNYKNPMFKTELKNFKQKIKWKFTSQNFREIFFNEFNRTSLIRIHTVERLK